LKLEIGKGHHFFNFVAAFLHNLDHLIAFEETNVRQFHRYRRFWRERDFSPVHVLNAILDVDVGVVGDNLANAYLTEVGGHNEALLGFNAKLKEIVHQNLNVFRRLSCFIMIVRRRWYR